jgi:hypothetical protein
MKLRTRKTLASFALALLARTAGAESSGAPPWQEGFTARLEALALLETLNAELLSHESATLTLDRWCAAHRLASPARIVAERVDGAYQAPTDEQRQLLGVNAMETIRYRRVRLICGGHVLSEADNWYVPARLTLASLVALTAGLGNGRPAGGVPRGTLTIPHEVLEHRAVLTLPDGTPFSEVVETYTGEVLAFPEPLWP